MRTLTENKLQVMVDQCQHQQLDILCLQDLDVSRHTDERWTELQKEVRWLSDNQYQIIANRKNKNQVNGDSGILLTNQIARKLVEISCPTNGRNVKVKLRIEGEEINIVSVYAPPCPISRPSFYLRTLYTAYRGCGQNLVIAGDFNAHLHVDDVCTESQEERKHGKRPHGILRDFVSQCQLTDCFHRACQPVQFTHEQNTSKGIFQSCKDRIFVKGNPKVVSPAQVQTFDSSVSDHALVVTELRLELPQSHLETESKETQVYFRDKLREYSPNIQEFFVLYRQKTADVNCAEALKQELLRNKFTMKSAIVTTTSKGHFRVGFKTPNEGWRNAKLFLETLSPHLHYWMPPCYHKVKAIQNTMRIPDSYDSFSAEKKLNWIHQCIISSMDAIVPRNNSGLGGKRLTRRTAQPLPAQEEHKLACQALKCIRHALKFAPSSRLYRRSVGKLRELLKISSVFKPHQLTRLEEYYEKRRQCLSSKKLAAQHKRTKHTLRALGHYKENMKRMFQDIQNMSSPPAMTSSVGEMNRDQQDDKLFAKLARWVPPMFPCEVDQPLFGTSYLEKIRRWTSFQVPGFPDELRNELNVKPDPEQKIWDSILKPVTIQDIDQATKHRKGGPGRTRITYRMILYSSKDIKTRIADVMTEMLKTGDIPQSLKVAQLKAMPKSPGVPVEEECRPIVILESTWRIFAIILAKRMQQVLKGHNLLFPNTFGFLENRNIEEALFLKQVTEEHARKHERPLVSIELDISKAYDFTRKHTVLAACERLGLPDVFLQLVKNMMENAFNEVVQGNRVLGVLPCTTLRQGGPLSCQLFLFQMDILVTAIHQRFRGYQITNGQHKTTDNTVTASSYVDDLATFHSSPREAQAVLDFVDKFLMINTQRLNANKTVARFINVTPVPLTYRGHPIRTICHSEISRYLGLHFAPDGSIDGSRKLLHESVNRLTHLLQSKLCSTTLRQICLKLFVGPKLNYLLQNMTWRLHDLEFVDNCLRKLIDPHVAQETLYAPERHGGAGGSSILYHAMGKFISRVLILLNKPGPHQTILEDLLKQEASQLETALNPLTIPVTKFTVDRKAPMNFIRTIREYLTFLNFTVVDLQDTGIDFLDAHHFLPEKKASELHLLNNEGKHTRLVDEVMHDEWYLDPDKGRLRSKPKTAQMILGASQPVPHTSWSNYPLRLTRVPMLQNSQLTRSSSFAKVVCYEYSITHTQEVTLCLANLESIREDRSIVIAPLTYVTTVNKKRVYKYDDSPETKWLNVNRTDVVSCGLIRRDNARFLISEETWCRDWKVVLLELLRQKLDAKNCIIPECTFKSEDTPWTIYTDGSLITTESRVYMGAGAVTREIATGERQCFCTTIDPVDTSVHGRIPGTTKPETVALTLGLYISYLESRRCTIVTDNQAVALTVQNQASWYKLTEFDAKTGPLAIRLLEMGILVQIRWIPSHQTGSSRLSEDAICNDMADRLAEASRNRAIISGTYCTLPVLLWERYTLLPYDQECKISVPQDRNQTLKWSALPFPDQAAARSPLLSWQWMNNLQIITYPARSSSTPTVQEDCASDILLCLTDIRIRNGNTPTAFEKITNRPDIYGCMGWCLACHKQIAESATTVEIYKHLFFNCGHPKIKAVFAKLRNIVCSKEQLEFFSARDRRSRTPRIALTGVIQPEDSLEKSRLCKACLEFRVVLNSSCDAPREDYLQASRLHWRVYILSLLYPRDYTKWKAYPLVMHPEVYEFLLASLPFLEPEEQIAMTDINPCFDDTAVVWVRPVPAQSVQTQQNLHIPHWKTMFGLVANDLWWTKQRCQGLKCRHLQRTHKGAVVYIRNTKAVDTNPLPISHLRDFWYWLTMNNPYEANGDDIPPRDTGLWLHNRSYKLDPVLTGMDAHGVHQWSGDNDWFLQYFSASPTTEVLVDQMGVLGYWLYKRQEELIKWAARSHAAKTAYDRTNRALDPLWVTFRKRNQITTQLERDRRRLREYTRSLSSGAPYRPYIELSLVEKKEVLQRLQLNRKNAAQNLPLMPIGK